MIIDLRSDTVTRPTAAMRRAMAEAEVGDDVLDGDPTVHRLEQRLADLLGMGGALFFPSGTMANQAALALLGRPGTELLLDADAHIIHWESAAAAALHGLQVRPVSGGTPVMDADALRRAIRPASRFAPAASMVALENTHNGAGGVATPLSDLRALRDVARDHGLAIHLDGARLWNAAAATGTGLADFAACADTVMVSFSKGLGAPVGAALGVPATRLEELWTIRKRLGGGMRQSGFLAAAALHALDVHLDRLPEDHARARELALAVAGVRGTAVVPPQTNIVMIDLPAGVGAGDIAERAASQGVLLSVWSPTRLRGVTHLDVDAAMIARAGEVLRGAITRG